MSNTPYDDVFRTLMNDCSPLVLPMLNEIFGEHYIGDEKIVFSPNEHFLNKQDGKQEKRITDSCFIVAQNKIKRYHLECESKNDSSILIRIFEYDAQIALATGELKEDILTVDFPNSALLLLRATNTTTDKMKVRINTPEGFIEYNIMVMKILTYKLEEILEKKLYFLLPFYIFKHEKNFDKYVEDEEKLNTLKKEFELIRSELERLCQSNVMDEFTKRTLIDMLSKVVEHIAVNFPIVKKGVKDIMGGQVLEHEAKTIRNEGRREGRQEGRQEGQREGRREGRDEGIEEEAKRYSVLMKLLLKDKKYDLIEKVADDKNFRYELYKKFNLL